MMSPSAHLLPPVAAAPPPSGKGLKSVLVLGAVLTVALLSLLYGAFFGANTFEGQEQQVFTVSRGQTFASIVDSLESRRIIRSRPLFVFVARVLGGTTRMQVGRYLVMSGVSNYRLHRMLTEGEGILAIQVTIPEGLRAQGQARVFARTLGIDSARYVQLVGDADIAREMQIPAPSLEGYLMPETYSFPWQPDELDVVKRLAGEFRRFYNDSLQARAKELGWTISQVMAMASIVEGEAMLDAERARISGVYHNRLRKGMFLQADPTVQFFLDGGPRRVLYSDLRIDNPYNTYRNKGLPPGPVNNPGKASILAALYPERHEFFFFVANFNGGHWFSKTYAEHQRYVREYRRLRGMTEPGGAPRAGNTKGPSKR